MFKAPFAHETAHNTRKVERDSKFEFYNSELQLKMIGKNIDLYTEEREKENLLLGIKKIQKKIQKSLK
jgi:hypothetical protein